MDNRLHIFNPEHDLVLAVEKQGLRHTPPKAARQLRLDLGFLPAFMADDGDWVLVDDAQVACTVARPFAAHLPDVRFVPPSEVRQMTADGLPLSIVCPWGWDADVRAELAGVGIDHRLMPDDDALWRIRWLSHRAQAIGLLEGMVAECPLTVGERRQAFGVEEVTGLIGLWGKVVVKSPWSSSGRGVRMIDREPTASELGFIRHVLAQQHSIIVEPFYDCLLNFAMEFVVAQGEVAYSGLSIFRNTGVAYEGNLLASEEEKWALLSGQIPLAALRAVADHVRQWLQEVMMPGGDEDREAQAAIPGCLPIGVDMMLVQTPHGIRIHPCVEINFRCTMGHVALHVARRTKGTWKSMAISFDGGHYELVLK